MPITFGDILVSLALTIIFYCTVPIVSVFLRKKPTTKKAYKKFVIINCVVVALLLSVLTFSQGNGVSNGAPAFLWGYVSYRFGLKQLRKRNLLEDVEHNGSNVAKPVDPDYGPVDPEDYFAEETWPKAIDEKEREI